MFESNPNSIADRSCVFHGDKGWESFGIFGRYEVPRCQLTQSTQRCRTVLLLLTWHRPLGKGEVRPTADEQSQKFKAYDAGGSESPNTETSCQGGAQLSNSGVQAIITSWETQSCSSFRFLSWESLGC